MEYYAAAKTENSMRFVASHLFAWLPAARAFLSAIGKEHWELTCFIPAQEKQRGSVSGKS